MHRTTLRTVAVVGVAGLVLAGCTSGGGGTTGSSAAGSTTAGSSTPATSTAPSTSDPASSGGATPTGGGSVPTGGGSTTPPGTPAPGGGNSCPASALSLEVVPASGASGVQYAIVVFTDKGTTSCTLSGFPGVSLLLGGKPIGAAATPTGTPVTTVTLAPGGTAQARVASQSTCDAPLSDTLRVTLPGTADYVDVAGELRACTLEVDAVTTS